MQIAHQEIEVGGPRCNDKMSLLKTAVALRAPRISRDFPISESLKWRRILKFPLRETLCT